VRPGQVSEIQRDRLQGGWQELEAVQRAPRRKKSAESMRYAFRVLGALAWRRSRARRRLPALGAPHALFAVDRRIVSLSAALDALQPFSSASMTTSVPSKHEKPEEAARQS
jgi:hypothetical protein